MKILEYTGQLIMVDENKKTAALVRYTENPPGVLSITETFVDPDFRGQGYAGQMMQAIADKIADEGKKARPVCSYAVKWFDSHPDYAALLAE